MPSETDSAASALASESSPRPIEGGAEGLAQLLAACGSALSLAEARSLVDGIAAAPLPPTRKGAEAWLALVHPGLPGAVEEPAATLRAELLSLAAERRVALEAGDGLEAIAADKRLVATRLAALRQEMAVRGLTGFIVPRADEHQGEYVPRHALRLAWLTGFTGSAGQAVILKSQAALFVDGRYRLQAETETDPACLDILHSTENPLVVWLEKALSRGDCLGYDPWLHTTEGTQGLRALCARLGVTLVPCEPNPLDTIWQGRPPPPLAPVVAHPASYCGRSHADKREEAAARLQANDADAALLSAPDSIAWLLNIRGGDLPHTPLALAFALLHRDGAVELFLDPRKLAPGLGDHLGTQVGLVPPAHLAEALDHLASTRLGRPARVLLDRSTAPIWVQSRLEAGGAAVLLAEDPCLEPKAIKNDTEQQAMRKAHLRDGIALTRFLHWYASQTEDALGETNELDIVRRLQAFRAEDPHYRDDSFSTICGAGPHGAVIHYRVSPASNRLLQPGELLLLDSGAQYLEGTTDVTRTLPIGTPSREHRETYTRVLKGHIAIATVRFPAGTQGCQLDVLARWPLWQVGRDYDHGTGHGVGCYLSVHEGPQRIAKTTGRVALKPGMILSNEPGYYKAGAYGIRLENLICVRSCGDWTEADRPMLRFDTLTLAPFCRHLIEPSLLTQDEIDWIDAYHRTIRETLSPFLEAGKHEAAIDWLHDDTRPLQQWWERPSRVV